MLINRLRRSLLALGALVSLVAAAPTWAAETFTPFEVTDLAGRTVKVDKAPQRFVVANYIANFLMVGGAKSLDNVVAMTQDGWVETRRGEYEVLTQAFPKIKEIPSIGGYHDNILNSEKILALRPDVVLINTSQYADNSQRVDIFEKAGIRVVVLDYHAMKQANHIQSTQILGKLLGRELVAQAQSERYAEVINTIDSRIAQLPDSAKHKRVYIEAGTKGVGEYGNSYNGSVLWGAIVKNLQGANIAENMKQPYSPLDREFVLAQNPQVIVMAGSIWHNANESDQMRMGLTVDEATAQARLAGFAKRPLWEKLSAVQTGDVYAVDHGSLRCMLDYTFSMFLAKVLYPETFADFNPKVELEMFYKTYLPEVDARGTFFIQLDK
ncbi:MAG: ABC transporter substrate-binding protein [Sutterellaceae bacterium]|nr:ABC transporter substrate-binding protein [Sutterellaceae bacterium]